jgi:hypothetical protein
MADAEGDSIVLLASSGKHARNLKRNGGNPKNMAHFGRCKTSKRLKVAGTVNGGNAVQRRDALQRLQRHFKNSGRQEGCSLLLTKVTSSQTESAAMSLLWK